MRKPSSKTATREVTQTAARKRRLSNVKTRPGETLSSAEENVLRMHHGMEVGLHDPLPSNAVNSALRQYLLDIEKRAYLATGRHLQDPEGEEPEANDEAKDRIVAKLKRAR
ncbi:MAG: hypothetical protein HY904_01195 [Deltaproteobacteria bacterium]|nr:hypothetical protein [Deltaproteobacteria bacterium]